MESKYNNLVLRCFFIFLFGVAVYIAGSIEKLWNFLLTEYNRVSTQSAQIHTMFGKEVELKYTARACALALLSLFIFVAWPVLRFVVSITFFVLKTVVKKKGCVLITTFLLLSLGGVVWYFEYTDDIQNQFEMVSGNISTLFDSVLIFEKTDL